MNKTYITANELLEDSYRLAIEILESDFRPTFLLAVWRGGTPIGIAIQEVFSVCGLSLDHIAIRTASYSGIDRRNKKVVVSGLEYVVNTLTAEDRVLIVDDVHDSGLSVEEVIVELQRQCGDKAPQEIQLATVYYKPNRSEVSRVPNFYIYETEDWLVFPHELEGLTEEELVAHKPGISKIRDRLISDMHAEFARTRKNL